MHKVRPGFIEIAIRTDGNKEVRCVTVSLDKFLDALSEMTDDMPWVDPRPGRPRSDKEEKKPVPNQRRARYGDGPTI